ncbi:MAG: flagellar export protein FliJ [Acidobacteria bacterium]|nr:flagellar export protein FliJ [Acidobacteriota bacterium]
MKRFSFNLETLLRHRRHIEEKERSELSRLFSSYKSELNQRETLQRKYLETLLELAQKRQGALDHQEMSWFYLYLERLRLELEYSAQRILNLEKQIQTQQAALYEASKKRKAIDALKARRRRHHAAAAAREEQRGIDELVVTRFARQGA